MIFCVEDDAGIRNMMVYTLQSVGYEVTGISSGDKLFDALVHHKPTLIMLDIMLPGMDGIQILKMLREKSTTANVPVIMATAKGSEYDKVNGLDLGADDYLVKPFGMMEMVSRVKAVLRRATPEDSAQQLSAGNLSIHVKEHTVMAGDNRIVLTLKEFQVLRMMMERPGQVFTRDCLLGEIWGYDFDGETRTVDVHIRTLRQKLGDFGSYIETVRGVGYRLATPSL